MEPCFLSGLLAGPDVGDALFCFGGFFHEKAEGNRNILPMFGQEGSIATESSQVSVMA